MFVESTFHKALLPINGGVDRNVIEVRPQLKQQLRSDQKTIWTFLSQGLVAGAFGGFLHLFSTVFLSRNFYNFLLIIWLPYFMAWGGVLGLIAGATTRLYTKLRKTEPGLVIRVLSGMLIAGLACVLVELCESGRLSKDDFVPIILYSALIGTSIGLLTGSKLRLSWILAYGFGKQHTKRGVVEVIGGVGVRLGSVIGLLQFSFAWACLLSVNLQRGERLFLQYALLYLAIGSLVSLAPLTRWIRTIAALLLNSPLILLLLDPPELGFFRHVILVYLILWMVFILGSHLPEKANAFITSEFRYYLID